MLYQKLEDLAAYAVQKDNTEVAQKLNQIIDDAITAASDPQELCHYIDSFMHEVEQNLKADEYEWRRYEGDGNQKQLVVTDILWDNADIRSLEQKGFGREQVNTILNQAAARYCN